MPIYFIFYSCNTFYDLQEGGSMIVINKLKTAKMVLFKYGFKEVFGLLCDNIEMGYFRIYRKIGSLFNRILNKSLLVKLKRNHPEMLKILYVTSLEQTEHGQTIRYRIYNFIEALKDKAEARLEVVENGIYKDENSIKQADIIIIMRVMWTEEVGQLISLAKKHSVPIVYDIDDIIFLPEYAEYFCTAINESHMTRAYEKEFSKYQKVFQNCDYATTSTRYIAEQMKKAGKTAFVIPNALNKKQMSIARGIKKTHSDELTICYLSGSKTHDRDFIAAVPALARIIKEYDNVRLSIVGYLDTESLPIELLQKTTVMCYMSWKRLLKVSADNYINLAPLDIGNPFCHAKSELKFYEAAIVKVPTIASKTETFNHCIQDKKNGLLASTEDEWYLSMKALIEDKTLYETVVQNGYETVNRHYTPAATAEVALSTYKTIMLLYKKSKGLI
jgi:glycosyltransferase involved in cell wall biosynthesis